ncbi:MAG: glucose-6-phosphate isomerase [Alphaproteobacteria bacterium]|nr:glucose-6-phosphate isomerase [Alphaproteobacteria bacterium]
MTTSSIPFETTLDLALTGKGAVARPVYDDCLREAETALNWLRTARDDSSIELFSVPGRKDDVAAAQTIAEQVRYGASTIAVLGIGGSSLGGKALQSLQATDGKDLRIEFFDNPDPWSWSAALRRFDLRTTRFLVISKSGGTAETLIQALTAADAIEKAGGGKYLGQHFVAITEPHDSALRKFADSISAPVLDHPTGIGGRFSVLTVVGVLPALLMGLDVAALRGGAAMVLDHAMEHRAEDVPAATGAALHHALSKEGRMRETVLWAYADRLHTMGAWWRQLWAESLGKDGKGSTPVSALGPVDQHSQLQLFRDGPNQSLFTILSARTEGEGPEAPAERSNALGLSYLSGRHVGDLVAAEARATAETLSRNGRPVRQMHLNSINERSMGALMMHFMLETMIMGRLMEVNPFDQPGVEEGKVLARQYLSAKK